MSSSLYEGAWGIETKTLEELAKMNIFITAKQLLEERERIVTALKREALNETDKGKGD